MSHLELWKLCADILLLVGLGWLGLRLARGQGSSVTGMREVRELEASLKELLHEAEGASRTLQERLSRRQQGLERLLQDLESAEHRARDTLRARPEPEAAARSAVKLEREAAAPRRAAPLEPPPGKASAGPLSSQIETIQEPTRESAVSRWSATNIYGDPIPPPASPAAPAAATPARTPAPIAKQIEVEVSPTAGAIDEVYAAAEELLRAGRDLEFVSRRTRLPLEEVRMLSRIVIQENQARRGEPGASVIDEPVAGADPRLGVLGTPIRRQVQTI